MEGGVELDQTPEALTEEDVVVIEETWRPVYQERESAGVAVLIRYSLSLPLSLSTTHSLCICKTPVESGTSSDSRDLKEGRAVSSRVFKHGVPHFSGNMEGVEAGDENRERQGTRGSVETLEL
ncbi:hypothetical protein DNTS_022133 [Danionella cerebrum]|uniref:Uncharacterized protein n=1 Tax=Danionella cerebrum TaxID=2873325 RepID=A0A553R0M6_9TELE|nr:hypothetical protein DNTS_022133 [Danionella translucida]